MIGASLEGVRMASVLVVEHDPSVRAFVTGSLTPLGCDVWAASTGEEVWRRVARRDFDLVLVGSLPSLDAIETIELFGVAPQAAACVLLMGEFEPGILSRAAALGVAGRIHSPLDRAAVQEAAVTAIWDAGSMAARRRAFQREAARAVPDGRTSSRLA